jgi:hypothetical protein
MPIVGRDRVRTIDDFRPGDRSRLAKRLAARVRGDGAAYPVSIASLAYAGCDRVCRIELVARSR